MSTNDKQEQKSLAIFVAVYLVGIFLPGTGREHVHHALAVSELKKGWSVFRLSPNTSCLPFKKDISLRACRAWLVFFKGLKSSLLDATVNLYEMTLLGLYCYLSQSRLFQTVTIQFKYRVPPKVLVMGCDRSNTGWLCPSHGV